MSSVYLTESTLAFALNVCCVPGCDAPRYRPHENSQLFSRCETHQKAEWRKQQQKRRREVCSVEGCGQPVHQTDSRRFSKCYQHASADWNKSEARRKAKREAGIAPRPYRSSLEVPATPTRRSPRPADVPPTGWRWWEQPINHADRQVALVRHLGGKAEVIP